MFTDSHHLAHEASAMHLRDAAGGRFEASAAAAAPAPRRNATISYSFWSDNNVSTTVSDHCDRITYAVFYMLVTCAHAV